MIKKAENDQTSPVIIEKKRKTENVNSNSQIEENETILIEQESGGEKKRSCLGIKSYFAPKVNMA